MFNFCGYIYKITNKINGKVYIGQTTRSVEQRWKEHKNLSKRKSQLYLHRSMRKYGIENFIVSVIGTASNYEILNKYEQKAIKKFKSLSPNGYNSVTGGLNFQVSDCTKLKFSQSHGGKPFLARNLETNEITEFNTHSECENHIQADVSDLSKALRNKTQTISGYSFSYKDTGKLPLTKEEIELIRYRKNHNNHSILMRNLKTNKILTFNSIKECGQYLNIKKYSSISRCLRQERYSYKNYSFAYKNYKNLPLTKEEIKSYIRNKISSGMKSKPFLARNLETNEIREFNTQVECKEQLSVNNIDKCLNGTIYYSKNYSFSYKDTGKLPLTKEEILKIKKTKRK